ncbi:MAG: phosphoribosylaminoimidazolesuccinocarboxamide synthase [Synergistaceae bacterium]|nr:phosphoribosylaminoimidazolesuccinocarboxamide synthase [Synergistaceae bacterium]
MTKLEQRYEGKAKKVFAASDPSYYIVEYKDDATAFNGLKHGTITGKGIINNKMSNMMFRLLEQHGVRTHFVEQLSDRETLVKAVEIVPLEIIIRNIAAGSFSKRYGVEEGTPLKNPTLEFSLKNDALNDPLINDSHITALGVATEQELAAIRAMAYKVNDVLKEFFAGIGIKLVDFKIEAGRLPDGEIILADEISPDTCRFWDAKTNEKLDKDRFRRDMGGVEEAYHEIFSRISNV